MIKYYEVIFDNDTGESICIRSLSEPTIETLENNDVFKKDMKTVGFDHIVDVQEIPKQLAYDCFNMEHTNYVYDLRR